MESRIAATVDNHKKGYNCSQAVLCAYADLFGMDEKQAFAVSEGFGAGMGSMDGTCGAMAAVIMLAGLKNSVGDLDKAGASKAETYQLVRRLKQVFSEKNGSVVCSELKGIGTGKMLRSCDGCIEDAARIIEEMLL